ncbi:antitoxin Phd [Curtobacterium flaccumfaciens]|nr:antitoxin Phd [Curtobacterium flaccumfaciens]
MPSLNVAFTEAELEEIRTASAGSSLKTYVHDQALLAARNRKALVAQLAQQVATSSAELNARLA